MCLCCKSEFNVDKESIEKQIESLQSIEDKKKFLENVFYEYQLILTEEEQIIRQYGYDSEEIKEFYNSKTEKDNFYISHIDVFFDKYGYPNRSELGQYAAIVPLIVHFYASNNLGFKKEHFKYFYGAFKFNDIPAEYFLAYLNEYYEFNVGKTFTKKKSMDVTEEIYAIMDAMNIDY